MTTLAARVLLFCLFFVLEHAASVDSFIRPLTPLVALRRPCQKTHRPFVQKSVAIHSIIDGFYPDSSVVTTTANHLLLPPMVTAALHMEGSDASSLSKSSSVVIFLVGLVPFLWATIEFWRRIAIGAPFGTGSDSVTISETERITTGSRRVLGKGALAVAYLLFTVAALTITIALYSVVTGPHS